MLLTGVLLTGVLLTGVLLTGVLLTYRSSTVGVHRFRWMARATYCMTTHTHTHSMTTHTEHDNTHGA